MKHTRSRSSSVNTESRPHPTSSTGTPLPIQYKACWYQEYDQSTHVPFKSRLDSIPPDTDGSVRSNNAMRKLRQLAGHAKFGAYEEIEYCTPRNNGGFNTYKTPKLTKQQDIYVSAALSVQYLLMALDGYHDSLPEEIRNLSTAEHIRYFQEKTASMLSESVRTEPEEVYAARMDALEALDNTIANGYEEFTDMCMVNNDRSLLQLLYNRSLGLTKEMVVVEPGDTWVEEYVAITKSMQESLGGLLDQYKICSLSEADSVLSKVRVYADKINAFTSNLEGTCMKIQNRGPVMDKYLPVIKASINEYRYGFNISTAAHSRLIYGLKKSGIAAADQKYKEFCRADIIEYGLYANIYDIAIKSEHFGELTKSYRQTTGYNDKQLSHIVNAVGALIELPRFSNGVTIVRYEPHYSWNVHVFALV
jgi:hypothetical protein